MNKDLLIAFLIALAASSLYMGVQDELKAQQETANQSMNAQPNMLPSSGANQFNKTNSQSLGGS